MKVMSLKFLLVPETEFSELNFTVKYFENMRVFKPIILHFFRIPKKKTDMKMLRQTQIVRCLKYCSGLTVVTDVSKERNVLIFEMKNF